jgi:uncharacterized membrane protein YecN with MAPEG domain
MASLSLPITSILAGFMAILILVLNVQFSMRQIQLGDDVFKNMTDGAGDDKLIRRRIAFMSAAFNIPMSIILLGLIEMNGSSRIQVIILAVILIISRILHPICCYYQTLPKIRSFAFMIQFAYYIVCGTWLMLSAYYTLSYK